MMELIESRLCPYQVLGEQGIDPVEKFSDNRVCLDDGYEVGTVRKVWLEDGWVMLSVELDHPLMESLWHRHMTAIKTPPDD